MTREESDIDDPSPWEDPDHIERDAADLWRRDVEAALARSLEANPVADVAQMRLRRAEVALDLATSRGEKTVPDLEGEPAPKPVPVSALANLVTTLREAGPAAERRDASARLTAGRQAARGQGAPPKGRSAP